MCCCRCSATAARHVSKAICSPHLPTGKIWELLRSELEMDGWGQLAARTNCCCHSCPCVPAGKIWEFLRSELEMDGRFKTLESKLNLIQDNLKVMAAEQCAFVAVQPQLWSCSRVGG